MEQLERKGRMFRSGAGMDRAEPYREGEGKGEGDDGEPAGGDIAPPAPLVAPAWSTHWSVEPAGLACSHAAIVAKMQLTLPDALLRQKGASPIGVCAAAIMGAATSAAAASMDVIRKRPLPALRNGCPLSAEQIIASMVPAAGRGGGRRHQGAPGGEVGRPPGQSSSRRSGIVAARWHLGPD